MRLGAAITVAAWLATGLAVSCGAQIGNAPSAPFPQPLFPDRYALFLNGGFADFLQDVQGGAISADVLEMREGGPANVKLVTAVMYCDSMEFVMPPGP